MTYLDIMTLYDNLSNRYSFWCFLFFFSPFSSRCCTARRTLPRCQPTYCAGRGYIFIPFMHRWISSFEILSDLLSICQLIWHAFFCTFSGLHHSLALDCLNCAIAPLSNARKSNSRCVAVDSVDSLDLAGFAGSIVEALRDGKGGTVHRKEWKTSKISGEEWQSCAYLLSCCAALLGSLMTIKVLLICMFCVYLFLNCSLSFSSSHELCILFSRFRSQRISSLFKCEKTPKNTKKKKQNDIKISK